MKKLLIAATLSAAAFAAAPLLAQTGEKPGETAATEPCAMTGGHGERNREHAAQMEQRHAQMQAMQEMHAHMDTHEGRGPHRGTQSEQHQQH